MANIIYTQFMDDLMGGSIDLVSDTVKASLIDLADYTPDAAADTHLDDVPGAAIEETVTMAGKAIVSGAFDADDLLFSGTAGDTCEAILLYKDTGLASTSTLIALIDTVAAGLPVALGGDVSVLWSNLDARIFKIAQPAITQDEPMLILSTGAPTAVNKTAASFEIVTYLATGAPFTITAPSASPAHGDAFGVKELSGNPAGITVAGNGKNIQDPITGDMAASVPVAVPDGLFTWQYSLEEDVWLIHQ